MQMESTQFNQDGFIIPSLNQAMLFQNDYNTLKIKPMPDLRYFLKKSFSKADAIL